jgi:hypothetical protein
MTNARPEVVDPSKRLTRKGRPKSKFYEPLEPAMLALVLVNRKRRFTAAKQILSLANGPLDQRLNQARALVRRFDESVKGGHLPAVQALFAEASPEMRHLQFHYWWYHSGLPWPPELKSRIDREIELRMQRTRSILMSRKK